MKYYTLVSCGPGTYFSDQSWLIVVEIPTGRVIDKHCYPQKIYKESTKGFSGVSKISNKRILVTREAEVMEYSLAPLKKIHHLTSPIFNDVHHAVKDDKEQLIVCNTGMETIEYFDVNYNHINSINLCCQKGSFKRLLRLLCGSGKSKIREYISILNDKKHEKNDFLKQDLRYKNLIHKPLFSNVRKKYFTKSLYKRDIDLRYTYFRPHFYHPNFLSTVNDEILITQKNSGNIITASNKNVIVGGLKGPHDGVWRNGKYFITECQSGVLSYIENANSIFDLKNKNLYSIPVCDPSKGFIRGVDMINHEIAVVAVSKRREVSDSKPAYLACVNINRVIPPFITEAISRAH